LDHLYDYLQFLAETVTVVAAVLVVLSAAAAFSLRRQQQGESGHLEVRKLNERLLALKDSLRQAVLPPAQFKKLHRRDSKSHKQEQKQAVKLAKEDGDQGHPVRPRIFVLRFEGDMQASSVEQLRTEITAVLTLAGTSDEVVVCLESPGGAVHGYGLAASQLDRVRAHGIPLVVVVDKVAASGGYLMAAVADRILAAPFAVIGSIGVLAQIPNIHRLLKKHDVDVELLTAGKYKRTLTVLGENTEEGRQKFVEELEDIHALFQEFVGSRRPQLDMLEVATGEVWYGDRALARKLVDELCTSDEYLARACDDKDVYEVRWVEHKRPLERLLAHAEGAVARLADRVTGMGHR